jgi:ADP-heptose:LPS heptosyltransferase
MKRPPELAGFYAATRDAKKIVVVDLGFLGDTVHLVPALWDIKGHYPNAALHVVSAPVGAEVAQLAPCVDRAWPVVLDPKKRSLREQWQLVRDLRRERFDVAFNFPGADRTTILTWLTGAPWRLAHEGGRRHVWNRWLIPNWAPRQDLDVTVYEQKRQVLAACGFKLQPPRFDLRVDDASIRWAEALAPRDALHISLNSATPFNEWPVEHYAALLQLLWKEFPDLRVVASGSAREREQARLQGLRTAVDDQRLQILPNNLRIAQLAAVLKQCRMHFGPDSGVMHLATALGVPAVALFREQKGYKGLIPVGPQHRPITFPCNCLEERKAACLQSGRAECFALIQPASVAEIMSGRLAKQQFART